MISNEGYDKRMGLKVKHFITEPLLFYIIVLNYLKPDSFGNVGLPDIIVSISALWDRLFGVVIILLCLLALLEDRKNRIADILFFYAYKIIGTIVVTLFATHLLSGGGAFSHLRRLSVIWYLALCLKYNFKETVNRLSFLLTVMIMLNLISILLFPHGMYKDDNWQNYFLGYDNGHVVVFLPGLYFATLRAYYTKRKTLLFLNWFCVLSSILICRSGTTIAGIAFLIVILILIYFPVVRNFLFNWKTVLIFIAGVFFYIIIFRKQEMFANEMMKYLGKDSTFTGRIYLWDKALEVFQQHKWFGIGDSADINTGIFTLFNQKLSYAHNEILDLLVRSGIIGLCIYLFCIARTIFSLRGKRDLNSKIWLAFMATYWLIMMFESYSSYFFYYLYIVMLVTPRFESNKSEGQIRRNEQKNSKKLCL